ncbi:cytochrome c3 family protein [Pseudobacteriovorax antillogorgiicola]|uniref:Class III cytochrome C domain-containing protein n=1 Tax=Pseudobacteriovorax antillogorgiicola TaxID=1513793 RepID=A0A1Y6C620_9BACT|nr:cytochrome c3 family protein [Pseudobacteriovorax antillogorgiicola]TCS51269.1 hypothetical protein EDD56_111154 [Pseudobacteriovorax antillogorgiicola]SMF36384.1 hypothetical protein SAMN06296036_11124 [Pseudobacteriovorax antillogorgiicola]
MRNFKFIIAALLTMMASSSLAQSDSKKFEGLMNKLLAPGPLMIGHEKLEHTDCLTCHDPGGGIPNKGCVDCHKGIGVQLRQKKSFHGLMGGKACVDCHKDHKGRDFNAVRFDEKNFDHKRTGFILDGAHTKVECTDCHTEKRLNKPINRSDTRWFGKSPSCRECHADDDIHRYTGKFAKVECSKCHNTTEWKDTKFFDHARETGYALIGAHARNKCSDCHAPKGKGSEIYDFPGLKTRKCLTCHEDHHGRNLSPKFQNGNCDTCHSQEKWDITGFKHEVTGWPLRGKHAQNQCIDCHKPGNQGKKLADFRWVGLNKSCGSCHADYHGYGNTKPKRMPSLSNCAQCHNEFGWKQNIQFNHNSQTIFPLEGKHLRNDCFQCHVTLKGQTKGKTNERRIYHFKSLTTKTCETCHKSPHSSAFHRRFKGVKCADCHTPRGWNIMAGAKGMPGGDRRFHQNTRFPLTGKHTNQPCKSCHLVNGKERYKFPNADKGFCVNCHDSVHKKQFTPKFVRMGCGECHTTMSFGKRKPFNHNITDFKITGQHKKFEKNCSKCHVPTRAKLPTKPPKTAHKFKFKFAKNGYCENCHNNVHRKQFSPEFIRRSACTDCHTTNSFTKRKPFNHDKTRFKLTGRHAKVKNNCFECHVKTNKKLPTKPPKVAHKFQFPGENRGFCDNCHKNEHRDMFRAKFYRKPCGECHKTSTFGDLKRFNHSETNFALRYKHKKVECKECHTRTAKRFTQGRKARKGRYMFPDLKTRNCQVCHRDPHKGTNGTRCTKCHTEAGWKKADGFHKDFTLEGVHLVLGCDQCHIEEKVLRGSSEDCRVCHHEDDPHGGFLNDCQDCHTQTVWESTTFIHDMTQFPLRGVHRLTDCRSCHNQGNYVALPTDCAGCHQSQADLVTSPNHSSSRYQSCEQCHNTFSFSGAVE